MATHCGDSKACLSADAGDPALLAAAFEAVRPRLRQSVAVRMDRRLRKRVDPSDVVQETFVQVLRRSREFANLADRMPAYVWFRLLALQQLVDLQRFHLGAQCRDAALEISLDRPELPQASGVWLAEALLDRGGTGSGVAARRETQLGVQAGLAKMDAIDREVLAMRHFELMSNSEIAHALGISESAASNRYVRAVRRLKALLAAGPM